MDELSQLDELIESDILDALGQKKSDQVCSKEELESEDDEISIEDFDEPIDETENLADNNEEVVDEVVTQSSLQTENEKVISSVTSNDLASLLSQLLNNKTIEITIKIKD
ncbi:MAG: hypothetical protein WBG69_07505 [Arcobacteraceae bacterium]